MMVTDKNERVLLHEALSLDPFILPYDPQNHRISNLINRSTQAAEDCLGPRLSLERISNASVALRN